MLDHTLLGHWVRRFLLEYAASERNLSANTRASYRDMLILLLPYLAKQRCMAVDALLVTDLSPKVVRSFLAYLERERQCCTATRNQRARLDSCTGTFHWGAQSRTRRLVRSDPNGAVQERNYRLFDVLREGRNGRTARRSR